MYASSSSRRRSLIDMEASSNFAMKDSAQCASKEGRAKREIQHNYHDHANDDGAIYLETPVVSKGGVTIPFPMRLHNMLEHISLNEPDFNEIVSWQPHGRCFLVKDVKAFSSQVLPRFFQQRKYASFQRQLNLYGFNRLTKGADRGSYYHELFLRSKQILCRGIQRMKVKGTGSRMASNPDQEPNFYKMSTMPASLPVIYEDDEPKMPPVNNPQSLNFNGGPLTKEESDHLNFVFGNMPFHALDANDSRRHSLMDYRRRLSMQLGLQTPTATMTNEQLMESARRLSRRSSLRRNSLRRSALLVNEALKYSIGHRNSMVMDDSAFQQEMEAIAQAAGEHDLSEQEFSNMIDKIVDHRLA